MRALRKGQARAWQIQPGIHGEVRLIERAISIGPSVVAEMMTLAQEFLQLAA